MATSLRKFSRAAQKILVAQNLGGLQPPSPPRPVRLWTQQTLLAINLASQQKTTKLYFSSRVRKQFKLLTVLFKPLRCCLRSDKLVNCHV